MGRMKSKHVRTVGKELVSKHSDAFGTNFSENSKVIRETGMVRSKEERNKLAGEITNEMKHKKANEQHEIHAPIQEAVPTEKNEVVAEKTEVPAEAVQ